MAEIMGLDSGALPRLASSTLGVYLLIGLGVVILLGISALIVWWYFQRKLYKFDIVVFENISGQGWQISMRDRAKYLRLSKDGTEVFWLKKKKMPLTAYGKKMGLNQYWFAIGQDGCWYNIVLGDLDATMGTLDIEPVDRDVKYASVAMRKNAMENYGPKLTWFDKYGSWVMGGVILIIFFVGNYYILKQMGSIGKELTRAAIEFRNVAEPISRALGHVDSICSGGSGLISA